MHVFDARDSLDDNVYEFKVQKATKGRYISPVSTYKVFRVGLVNEMFSFTMYILG